VYVHGKEDGVESGSFLYIIPDNDISSSENVVEISFPKSRGRLFS
jgi:hypothetical protein